MARRKCRLYSSRRLHPMWASANLPSPWSSLQHVLRPWFYFHPWIVSNENQWWSGAKQMRDQSGSLQALCLRGVSITAILPWFQPLAPSQPHGKNCWGSSFFSYIINFSFWFLIYWEMNCINRIVPCTFHFISLFSFQFLFISTIIRGHGPFNSTKFMI